MTKAASILEQMGISLKDEVTLEVNGVAFTFKRNDQAYAELQTMIAKGEAVTGIKQYLIDVVADADRENLLAVINIAGFIDPVMAKIRETFVPKFELTVKN